MDGSRSENIKRCFVMRREDVSALNKTIRDFLRANARVTYKLACNDGMDRESADVKKLTDYDNPRDKFIKRIDISGFSEDSSRHCSVTLSDESFFSNVRIHANGGEAAVQTFFDSIQQRLIDMTPWYGRLAALEFVSILMTLILLLSFGLLIVIFYLIAIGESTFQHSFILHGYEWIIACFALSFCFCVGLALNYARSWTFPLAVFAIGQGEKRYDEQDWWRRFLVGTVLIGGIIVGGTVAVLANLVTK